MPSQLSTLTFKRMVTSHATFDTCSEHVLTSSLLALMQPAILVICLLWPLSIFTEIALLLIHASAFVHRDMKHA